MPGEHVERNQLQSFGTINNPPHFAVTPTPLVSNKGKFLIRGKLGDEAYHERNTSHTSTFLGPPSVNRPNARNGYRNSWD